MYTTTRNNFPRNGPAWSACSLLHGLSGAAYKYWAGVLIWITRFEIGRVGLFASSRHITNSPLRIAFKQAGVSNWRYGAENSAITNSKEIVIGSTTECQVAYPERAWLCGVSKWARTWWSLTAADLFKPCQNVVMPLLFGRHAYNLARICIWACAGTLTCSAKTISGAKYLAPPLNRLFTSSDFTSSKLHDIVYMMTLRDIANVSLDYCPKEYFTHGSYNKERLDSGPQSPRQK